MEKVLLVGVNSGRDAEFERSMEELENLDGEETARLLIDSGEGVVTSYGVAYDNGMKLETSRRSIPVILV